MNVVVGLNEEPVARIEDREAEVDGLPWPSRSSLLVPSFSHTIALPSCPAVTIRFPSGEKSADQTHQLWPLSTCSVAPLARSHTRAVLSYEPLTSCRPSGEKRTLSTPSVCPGSAFNSRPVAASRILIVLSILALAICCPVGE